MSQDLSRSPTPGSGLSSTFPRLLEQQSEQLYCETSPYPVPAALPVAVWFGATERTLQHSQFKYTSNPNVTSVGPTKSFFRCGAKSMCGKSLKFSSGGGCGVLGMGAVNPLLLTEWVMNLGLGSWLGPSYALSPGLCKS